MARIPAEEVERLKRDVSLERLVTAKGVELSKRGDGLVGRCPFHEDKTPSLNVSPAKNLFRCFGCGAAGSVVDWVMRTEGVSFRHAVELLRADVPVSERVVKVGSVRQLPSPIDESADDAQLLNQVRDYYHQTLQQSPEAWAYLEKRGLKHAECVDTFKLGFANRTLGLRLPAANREAGARVRGRLQKLGVLRESGHEHLNGSLVVPLHDEAGQVVGMYGRKVTEGLRPGTPLHMYLPGPHRAAFNSAALAGQRSVILCEALLDALSFWCAGFRNVTSAYGVDGFTPHHLEAFKRHGVKDVLLAFDRDDAGDAGAELLSKELQADGFSCWRVLFPRGMDVNEYALKVQPATKSLGVALRQAAWMGAGKPPVVPEVSAPALAIAAAPPAPLPSTAPTVPLAEAPAIALQVGLEVGGDSGAAANVTAVEPSISAAAPTRPTANAPTQSSTAASTTETSDEEVVLHFGPRRYRVRGLSKALSAESLKVNLLVGQAEAFHVDTVEMYSARHRAAFLQQAAAELRVPEEALKRELGAVLLKLEELQEKQLKEKLQPKRAAPALSESEAAAALELLRAPNLLERILTDFNRCGVVGEETNKLVGYLAAVSRKLDEPLAVLIQSSSAAGKTSLMEAVLAFVPEEDKTKYSAMTGQSLFYMGDADLKHKVLAVVEEEGASRASYALKLLQSEGELTIASTGKDPSSGRLVTHEYRVEGPTQLFLTTTASELDEELLNRCVVLSVDEERAQTQAIHQQQREKQTLEGLLARRARDAVLKLHQDAQRLLRPLPVVNPFARQLTFLDDRTRARRDFPKYLTLIRTVALLHQHQRPLRTVQHGDQVVEYIEATLDDVAVANRLAHQVLGRSLDELPPQTRRLLHLLEERLAALGREKELKREELRFTRREVREWAAMSDVQARLHLERLVRMEYLLVHRGARGQSFVYELLYDGSGKDGAPFLTGLADVGTLRGTSATATSRGSEGHLAGATRPQRGVIAPASRPGENGEKLKAVAAFSPSTADSTRSARLGSNGAAPSYVPVAEGAA